MTLKDLRKELRRLQDENRRYRQALRTLIEEPADDTIHVISGCFGRADQAYDPLRAAGVSMAGTKGMPVIVPPFSPTHGPLEPPTNDSLEARNAAFEINGATVRRPAGPMLDAEVLANHGPMRRSQAPLKGPFTFAANAAPCPTCGAIMLVRGDTQHCINCPATVSGAPEPLECEETRRWRLEPTRYTDLTKSPLAWIQVAVYYCERLALGQFGDRPVGQAVEDLVRCVEALPGAADTRLEAVYDLGAAARAQYAKFWAEAQAHVAQALTAKTIGIDHQTRLLFCLGSALTDYQEALAGMRDRGELPAEGPPPPTPMPDLLWTGKVPPRPPDAPPEVT